MNTSGNTYLAAKSWQKNESVMLGIGLHTDQQHGIELNTSLRYMSNISTQNHGDVLQLHSPKYRNLSYTYDVTIQLLLVDNVVTWTKHAIQPGLIFGIGHASNSTSNYREAPLNPHSSPSSEPFTANTQNQLAFELGVALDYILSGVVIECAYRYLNTGRGQLGLSPLQNIDEHLSTGNLQYHAISFGVRFDHAH